MTTSSPSTTIVVALMMIFAFMSVHSQCVCNGQTAPAREAHLVDPRAPHDYGTYCNTWDATDEEPWCRVEKDACGEDTFEIAPGLGLGLGLGMYWSHVPCKE